MTRRSRTRHPIKQMALEKKLRRQIVAGSLAPGDRLPIRTELQRRHRVSAITVQRALDHLVATGFVVPRGSLGTFVAERPPHLHRYGLVFFAQPGEPGWSRFSQVLMDRALGMRATGESDFRIVHCVGGTTGPAHESLMGEVEEHGFAGLCFANDPWPITGSPLLTATPLPKVALADQPAAPGVARVILDARSFLEQGMAQLAARGRRRLAVLANLGAHPGESLLAMARKHGLDLAAHHLQRLIPAAAAAARGLVHLLCRGDARTRPDALLLCDDHYLEPAMAGIADSELRPVADIDVVGHCNFPDPASARLPLQRLGYDVDTILRTAIAALSEQARHRGRIVDHRVAAVFAPVADQVP